ncbi:DUF3718 domain-containing protein [Shewanella sp. 3B26]|jgi:hypothetical protein|uniref:DUF3718 domain-containing protein n=1 Tax=Shewanella zhuhaiensis TaxID=2919576 RepID=A0AAJ1BHC1_9GAMM|nr:DUF3718 domain-containing protein [Shewanella zhuhaiensis]MCH4294790.1 DUF3718 domain-containing protein [Shewanella zhuhaiensis]
MRVLPLALAAVIAASFIPTQAKANTDPLVASICDYVKANDKNRLRKKLKESRVKLRNIYAGISCDGTSLLRTAMGAGANDVGEFIAKRLSASELGATEGDGMTIVAWAEANGHGGSPITAAIKDRLSGGGGEED